jgi:hypothetical protein
LGFRGLGFGVCVQFSVWSLGFGVWGAWFTVQGLGLIRIWGQGFRELGSGFRVYSSELRVQGLGFII